MVMIKEVRESKTVSDLAYCNGGVHMLLEVSDLYHSDKSIMQFTSVSNILQTENISRSSFA